MAFIAFYLRWRIPFSRLYCCLLNFYSFIRPFFFFHFISPLVTPLFPLWTHTQQIPESKSTEWLLIFGSLDFQHFFSLFNSLFGEINDSKSLQIGHEIEKWNVTAKRKAMWRHRTVRMESHFRLKTEFILVYSWILSIDMGCKLYVLGCTSV